MKYVMDDHGSFVAMAEDGSSPGSTRLILRGKFSLVAYENRNRGPEYRLVLLGFEPENRKQVFEVFHYEPLRASKPVKLWLAYDSPGMAKDWE